MEKPVPRDDEVLIKIHATTVTSTDCNMRNLTFVPGLFRLPVRLFMVGLFRPKVNRLGVDLAGEIKSVGKDVRRCKVGDHVFGTPGDAGGAHAEYICIPEDGALAKKPSMLTWEEAASIPLAGNTALHFIRDLGQVRAGQKVLINGASGGIGTFAVQLAKYYGAGGSPRSRTTKRTTLDPTVAESSSCPKIHAAPNQIKRAINVHGQGRSSGAAKDPTGAFATTLEDLDGTVPHAEVPAADTTSRLSDAAHRHS